MKITKISNYNYRQVNNYNSYTDKQNNWDSASLGLSNQVEQPSFGCVSMSKKNFIKLMLIGVGALVTGIMIKCLSIYEDDVIYDMRKKNLQLEQSIDSANNAIKQAAIKEATDTTRFHFNDALEIVTDTVRRTKR